VIKISRRTSSSSDPFIIIFLIRFTVSEPERRTGLYPEDIPLQGLLALEVEDGHGDAAELVEGFAHEHA
jgi:hypothetical protein